MVHAAPEHSNVSLRRHVCQGRMLTIPKASGGVIPGHRWLVLALKAQSM